MLKMSAPVEERKKITVAAKTARLAYAGMSVALIAALSQISVPLPSGVPVTMQTFAVAFAAYFLGGRRGVGAVCVYILLGLIGMPVFSNFTGGLHKIVGVTGGFIWGFLPMAAMCSAGGRIRNGAAAVALGLFGLALCHLAGAAQYALLSELPLGTAFVTVSVPFLIKDVISVAAAYSLAKAVGRSLRKEGKI